MLNFSTMKLRYVLIVFIILTKSVVVGQVIIPNAIQQPGWAFPIYIEDAIGQRDTVYYGYDKHSDSCYGPFCPEKYFGEKFIAIDNSIMQAAIDYKFSGTGMDSLLRVDIRDSMWFYQSQSYSFNLSVQNAHKPIKLSYLNQLLYSDSLPFLAQANLPRAQVAVDAFYASNYINNCIGQYLLITDTSILNNCNYPDSVTVQSFGPNISAFQFAILFEPWNGISHTGINENEKDKSVTIYPNPANNLISIESKDFVLTVEIIDLMGKLLLYQPINKLQNFQVKLNDILPGAYIIKIKLDNGSSNINRVIKLKN